MKDEMAYIHTEKRDYPIIFNLNVMEEIQEQYGSIENWGLTVQGENGEPTIKDIKYGLEAMINEGIDILNEEKGVNNPFVTSKQVGRIISEVGLVEVTKAIQDLTIKSTSTGDEPKNE